MPTKVLTNVFHVDAAPEAVLDHLTTPENYVGLSPLVVEVRDVDRSQPGVVAYTSIERFRFFGVIRYDNAIRVTLHHDDGSVYGEVRSPGRIRMAYRFSFTPDGSGSRIDDRLELTAPWFLLGYAAGEARKVQLARARILAGRLAAVPR
ncbi:SRPBCC family protein [Microbispora sp. RL4-1S]|uniref:SRPBCC family protein n=1 Tax=Microbispora oryzae TaxID=2806554 RepID=A0A940WP89_9ACTN|nr:SRPBCC family protein [Microbispora oryzae]MBP2704631.1 SRPBCC family protein [Microbispora oryzae]